MYPAVDAFLSSLQDTAAALLALDSALLSNSDRLALLVGTETAQRVVTAASHTWLNHLAEQSGFDAVTGALGSGGVPMALAHVLRISRSAASARLAVTRDLGRSTAVNGDELPARLPRTADAASCGVLDTAHIKTIRKFLADLPVSVDADTRNDAEEHLARLARTLTPEDLTAVAARLTDYLDPDGAEPDDMDRARKRFFTIDPHGRDTMSSGRFCADPELRGYLEALFAKYAAPGAEDPATSYPDTTDTTDTTDTSAAADTRDLRQRRHDALSRILRNAIATGDHGTHNGYPVAIIASVGLDQLRVAAGKARTATGSDIPVRDLIHLAARSDHYLRVFDDATGATLDFLRARRTASTHQRLILFARDRGCTAPTCTAPAVHCQAHHTHSWAEGGSTDVDQLALACKPHHRSADPGPHQWETTITPPGHRHPGSVQWHPPAALDPTRAPRINNHHHPERYLEPPSGDP